MSITCRLILKTCRLDFTKEDIASAWLASPKLASKGNNTHQAFNAVLHASQLGKESATIEHSRLLWMDGHHRKAIQSLEGAISANAFIRYNNGQHDEQAGAASENAKSREQNLLEAKVVLISSFETHINSL